MGSRFVIRYIEGERLTYLVSFGVLQGSCDVKLAYRFNQSDIDDGFTKYCMHRIRQKFIGATNIELIEV